MGKTRENIFSKLSRIVAGKREIDASFLDEIEEALLTSDVGVDTTIEIINALEAKAKETGFLNIEELYFFQENDYLCKFLLLKNKIPGFHIKM